MSQRQEELRARMWEEVHKAVHEKAIAELHEIKADLDTMTPDSEEHEKKKNEYESKFKEAEEFFMKFYES